MPSSQSVTAELRGLLVSDAGCSYFFCDLGEALQEEIIARTEQTDF